MITMTLLAIGIAVTTGVLLSNKDVLSGEPNTSPPPGEDLTTGQSALNSLAYSSAPATVFNASSSGVEPKPAPFVAGDLRTPVPTTNAPSTLPSDSDVSRKKELPFYVLSRLITTCFTPFFVKAESVSNESTGSVISPESNKAAVTKNAEAEASESTIGFTDAPTPTHVQRPEWFQTLHADFTEISLVSL